MTELTVQGLAERVRRPGEDLKVVIDRLRNWKEGLLTLSSEKHPGTGRYRYYPEEAVLDALILTQLSAYGG